MNAAQAKRVGEFLPRIEEFLRRNDLQLTTSGIEIRDGDARDSIEIAVWACYLNGNDYQLRVGFGFYGQAYDTALHRAWNDEAGEMGEWSELDVTEIW